MWMIGAQYTNGSEKLCDHFHLRNRRVGAGGLPAKWARRGSCEGLVDDERRS